MERHGFEVWNGRVAATDADWNPAWTLGCEAEDRPWLLADHGANLMASLLIIDGHAYAYRAFHAIRELSSPSGRPTNAIYGFVKMVAKMRASVRPTHLVVVWDGGLSEERLAALPGYKAQRPEMPPSLESQLGGMQEYLQAAGIASVCEDGIEADDYIAFLTRRSVELGMEVVIASSDKDFMQLVGPGVGLLNPNDKSESIWGVNEVRAKSGVLPTQIVDWLSLVGDSVDNIPGVPGVGVKTAASLLNEFGSVCDLYARLDEVKSERQRGVLRESAADVERNLSLVRLKDDLPFDFSADDLRPKPVDVERLGGLFRGWGFKSLLAELEASRSEQGALL